MAQDGPAGDGQRQESAPPGGGAPRAVSHHIISS